MMKPEDIKVGRAYVTADDKADMLVESVQDGKVSYRYFWNAGVQKATKPIDAFAAWVTHEEDPKATPIGQVEITQEEVLSRSELEFPVEPPSN